MNLSRVSSAPFLSPFPLPLPDDEARTGDSEWDQGKAPLFTLSLSFPSFALLQRERRGIRQTEPRSLSLDLPPPEHSLVVPHNHFRHLFPSLLSTSKGKREGMRAVGVRRLENAKRSHTRDLLRLEHSSRRWSFAGTCTETHTETVVCR